ncbi:hypothetical protein NQ318_010511 [Aromia moschata]|uniref:Cytochrome P450 n=1 Tax=Aromia moschata TaxID=1265417 RepID=A0AAV8YDY9_9CUCU|nr:hypothetical protein NQ318_010511 [Aromia moschata]
MKAREYGKDKDLALIDQMLKNEAHLSDDEILQHLILFFLAERVYQEVVETVGKTNAIGPNDLPNLKYTEMAISESLRILPSIPFIARAVSEDMDMGTRIIPSDTDIVISIFDIHRNEKYWKDPLKYDPDRFLPEEMANRDPYTFLPFSAGPKNCIGKYFP